MAVSVDDIIGASGYINPAIVWPGQTTVWVNARVQAFITEAVELTGDVDADAVDAAVILWVRYRGKKDQYERLVGMPSSVADSDEGSSSYLVTQIQMIKDDMDALLEEFEEALVTGGAEEEEEYDTIQSLR